MTGLEDVLAGLVLPSLPTLARRAAGPGVQSAPPGADAWSVFRHLADFNAGADDVPPAMSFIELLARQVADRSVQARLWEWNEIQASRLGIGIELAKLRSNATPIAEGERLHLMIAIQHDGIEPDQFVVSSFRQDDPEEWPPARNEIRTVRASGIELLIDELVLDAERAWRGHLGTVALEFVLPRALLNLPVHLWHKEHDSGTTRPLFLDYPIVVRSLERMMSTHWHRVWNRRWNTLMSKPSNAEVYLGPLGDPGSPYAADAVLEQYPETVAIVLPEPPPPQPQPGDPLISALRSGVPAVVWPRSGTDPESLREIAAWLADEGGLGDLPARSHTLQRGALLGTAQFDITAVQDLVVLWDDPGRLIAPEELQDQRVIAGRQQPLQDKNALSSHGSAEPHPPYTLEREVPATAPPPEAQTPQSPELSEQHRTLARQGANPHEVKSSNFASGNLVVVTEPSRSAHSVSSDADANQVIPVEAYLTTNDEAVARLVTAALDDIARVLGYDAPYDEEFHRGSILRRAKARLRNGITSEEVKTRLIKVERAMELAGIDVKQAEVDSKSAEAVRQLIDSLAQVPEACMLVGSILLVKYQAGDVPVILTRRLSQIEIRALERFPEIQTKPRQVFEALSTAIVSIEPGADEGCVP